MNLDPGGLSYCFICKNDNNISGNRRTWDEWKGIRRAQSEKRKGLKKVPGMGFDR